MEKELVEDRDVFEINEQRWFDRSEQKVQLSSTWL
jgi:hypothetical protein